MYTEDQLKQEHKKHRDNKEALSQAKACSCFYCLRVFPYSKIKEWVGRHGTSALCPFCGIDAVLADVEPELVQAMHERWFH